MARGIPVGAVPGSIRSATSEGTNALLADGAFPVCSAGDILVALALAGAAVAGRRPAPAASPVGAGRRAPDPGRTGAVYDALSRRPRLPRRAGPGDRARSRRAVRRPERLAQAGLARDAGGWWERA